MCYNKRKCRILQQKHYYYVKRIIWEILCRHWLFLLHLNGKHQHHPLPNYGYVTVRGCNGDRKCIVSLSVQFQCGIHPPTTQQNVILIEFFLLSQHINVIVFPRKTHIICMYAKLEWNEYNFVTLCYFVWEAECVAHPHHSFQLQLVRLRLPLYSCQLFRSLKWNARMCRRMTSWRNGRKMQRE